MPASSFSHLPTNAAFPGPQGSGSGPAGTDEFRVDRTTLTVTGLEDPEGERYWWSRTPAERMRALEINRQVVYGYRDPPRFQRLLEVSGR